MFPLSYFSYNNIIDDTIGFVYNFFRKPKATCVSHQSFKRSSTAARRCRRHKHCRRVGWRYHPFAFKASVAHIDDRGR